jgi:N-acetylglucosaminyl-diphospho-decaprenol L-rhamnosyltransferase
MIAHATNGRLCISIVSHGHKKLVDELISQLATKTHLEIAQLIITCNRPDIESFDYLSSKIDYPFTVRCINNTQPQGFGKNHNQAFIYCESDFFCVVNPDIELENNPFGSLLRTSSLSNVGITYPLQVNGRNVLLDFERDLVSPASVAQRHLLTKRQQSAKKNVHWVNGAFMMFKSSAFREIGGFDERYFMYCEDVDICLRMQLAGYSIARADATVIHHTQRNTLKDPKHLAWHVRSLLRLWNSSAYKDYKQNFITSRKP